MRTLRAYCEVHTHATVQLRGKASARAPVGVHRLDGGRTGVRAMAAGGALVTRGTEVTDGMLAMGAPAKVRGPLAGTAAERWVRVTPEAYQLLAQRHKAGVTLVK